MSTDSSNFWILSSVLQSIAHDLSGPIILLEQKYARLKKLLHEEKLHPERVQVNLAELSDAIDLLKASNHKLQSCATELSEEKSKEIDFPKWFTNTIQNSSYTHQIELIHLAFETPVLTKIKTELFNQAFNLLLELIFENKYIQTIPIELVLEDDLIKVNLYSSQLETIENGQSESKKLFLRAIKGMFLRQAIELIWYNNQALICISIPKLHFS